MELAAVVQELRLKCQVADLDAVVETEGADILQGQETGCRQRWRCSTTISSPPETTHHPSVPKAFSDNTQHLKKTSPAPPKRPKTKIKRRNHHQFSNNRRASSGSFTKINVATLSFCINSTTLHNDHYSPNLSAALATLPAPYYFKS